MAKQTTKTTKTTAKAATTPAAVNPTTKSGTPAKPVEAATPAEAAKPETAKAADAKAAKAMPVMEVAAVLSLKKEHRVLCELLDKSGKPMYFGGVVIETGKDHVNIDVVSLGNRTIKPARFNVIDLPDGTKSFVHTDTGMAAKFGPLSENDRKKIDSAILDIRKNDKKAESVKTVPPVGTMIAVTYTAKALNPGLFVGRVKRVLPDMPGAFVVELCNEFCTPEDTLIRLASNEKSGYIDESFYQPIGELLFPVPADILARTETWLKMPKFNEPAKQTPQEKKAAEEAAKAAEQPKAAEAPKPEAVKTGKGKSAKPAEAPKAEPVKSEPPKAEPPKPATPAKKSAKPVKK